MCVSTADSELYIRFLIILFLGLFAFPVLNSVAAEVSNTYEEYEQTIKYRPNQDVIDQATAVWRAKQRSPSSYKAPCPWPDQCVCYIKQLVGVYGTWGDGGWKLSDNSGPMVGVAIIFNYTHIGLIKEFDGYNIGYTHQIKGKGILYSWTTIDDPTIWKYHKF